MIAAGFGKKKKRSAKTDDDITNILSRTVIDDQIDVLGVRLFLRSFSHLYTSLKDYNYYRKLKKLWTKVALLEGNVS